MEPITLTLVAVVTIAASTHRPKWENYLDPMQSPTTMVLPKQEVTAVPLIDRRAPTMPAQQSAGALKDRLYQELMTYLPVGNEDPSIEPVSKIDEILAANDFLQKLPGSIPLPTLQRNHAGQIGMYWDNDLVYIDVDIESGSTVSMYVREQSTDKQFMIEDVQINQIDANWFDTNIGQTLKFASVA